VSPVFAALALVHCGTQPSPEPSAAPPSATEPRASTSEAPNAGTRSIIVNSDSSRLQVTRYDVDGNSIDAHDGEIRQFGSTYYWYGTSYDCGFKWNQPDSVFCGFKVYSSGDLLHWADRGLLFDATTTVWQQRCGGQVYGCFRPHVLYNASMKKYVLWINDYSAGVNYRVFESSKPIGPFIEVAVPTLAVNSNGQPFNTNNGDENLFVDADGTGYIIYTDWLSGGDLVVERLNSQYDSGTGTFTRLGTTQVEAPAMFVRTGKYYITFSDMNCGYCNTNGTSYKTAPSPLGPWTPKSGNMHPGQGIIISSNSCNGQPTNVAVIPAADGTVYLYQSDRWNGSNQEAQANYFWEPLRFNADASIQPLSCVNSFTTPLASGTEMTKRPPGSPDQWSGTDGFHTYCDIRSGIERIQTFNATMSGTIKHLGFTTFRADAQPSGNPAGPGPNADLVIDIVTVDASGKPTSTLSSNSVPAGRIGYSPRNVIVVPVSATGSNPAIDAGSTYGIYVHTTSTSGCYGVAYNDNNPYAAGTEYYSSNGGAAFALESNRALKFETVAQPTSSANTNN
jgi:hypothetical protein